jgi:hypothetical protein
MRCALALRIAGDGQTITRRRALVKLLLRSGSTGSPTKAAGQESSGQQFARLGRFEKGFPINLGSRRFRGTEGAAEQTRQDIGHSHFPESSHLDEPG